MEKFLVLLMAFAWGSVLHAAEQKGRDETMLELAADLAVLQESVSRLSAETNIGVGSYVSAKKPGVVIFRRPDESSGELAMPSPEVELPVFDEYQGWLAVGVEKGADEYAIGWVKEADVDIPVRSPPFSSVSPKGKPFEESLKYVSDMKEKYKNNPYVRIVGFSVDFSIPPGVSVSFEFK